MPITKTTTINGKGKVVKEEYDDSGECCENYSCICKLLHAIFVFIGFLITFMGLFFMFTIKIFKQQEQDLKCDIYCIKLDNNKITNGLSVFLKKSPRGNCESTDEVYCYDFLLAKYSMWNHLLVEGGYFPITKESPWLKRQNQQLTRPDAHIDNAKFSNSVLGIQNDKWLEHFNNEEIVLRREEKEQV